MTCPIVILPLYKYFHRCCSEFWVEPNEKMSKMYEQRPKGYLTELPNLHRLIDGIPI